MIKVLVGILLGCGILFAQNLEITSDKFEADEKSQKTIFSGNVKLQHAKDTINCDRLVVLVDAKRKPYKYTAQGNASFKLFIQDKIYQGNAHEIEYEANKKLYSFYGDVTLKELTQNNSISAQKVLVDQVNGTYEVVGGKNRPAKFIFNIEEK